MRSGFGVLAVLASGCVVGGGDGTWSFTDASELYVSVSNGDVNVRPTSDGATNVSYDGGGLGRAGRPDVTEDDAGRVSVDGRGALGGGNIDADVVDGIPVTGLIDRGDLHVELQAPADVDACVGAGSVKIGLPPGSYRFDVAAGVGSIGIDFVDDPQAEHLIHVCLGAGDVDIHPFDPASLETPSSSD